jgi:two-component system chemotaxis sensor kinase CheA
MQLDPELLQDFLTESGELLEQLDVDLVTLEGSPEDLELLNKIFRALHTIKGSASFMALTNLVKIAHAAESALNAARNRVVVVRRGEMDLLLQAVDVIKTQFDDLRAARELTAPDDTLVLALAAIGEGKPAPSAQAPARPAATETNTPAEVPTAKTPAVPAQVAVPNPAPAAAGSPFDLGSPAPSPLNLPSSKMDLLEFLVSDLDDSLRQVEQQVTRLGEAAQRQSASESLADLTEALKRSAEFFDCEPMGKIASLLDDLAEAAPKMPEQTLARALSPAMTAVEALKQQSKALAAKTTLNHPLERFTEAFHALLAETATMGAPVPEQTPAAGQPVGASPAPTPSASPAPSAASPAKGAEKGEAHPTAGADHTIRVEVARLETLLNLVGELVLQKNRLSALTRQIGQQQLGTQEFREQIATASGGLDRVTSDLQLAVMRTRMQPLDKLFGKYPRLIRDLARKLNKQINLVIEGGETEVDKSVIEELGDPLVHLMRNSADHGIEPPEQRQAAGKPEMGTIRLSASHKGSHVQIVIQDDGRGIDKDRIARKAIEKGLYTEAQIAAMSEKDIQRIIFAAGFSTAEQISDVSGRGVGMDVVRANIEKVKGTIDLTSVHGQGTTITITIPLTVAILSAMMVGIGPETYAIPLGSILEIVRPTPEQRSSIRQAAVMRLRDTVLPLLSGGKLFAQPEGMEADEPFAVVLHQQDQRVGLLVTSLIGQQEVVIKPLDESVDKGGPVSGATVREDGGVSLIVDVPRLFSIAQTRARV